MVQMYLNLTARPGRATETVEALRSVVLSAQAVDPDVRCTVGAEAGRPDVVCYTEEWPDEESLSQRVRSLPFLRLLAIMETAAEPPRLEFRLVSETRGLEYVREVRLSDDGEVRRDPSVWRLVWLATLAFAVASVAALGTAHAAEPAADQSAELATKLANPVANLISLPSTAGSSGAAGRRHRALCSDISYLTRHSGVRATPWRPARGALRFPESLLISTFHLLHRAWHCSCCSSAMAGMYPSLTARPGQAMATSPALRSVALLAPTGPARAGRPRAGRRGGGRLHRVWSRQSAPAAVGGRRGC